MGRREIAGRARHERWVPPCGHVAGIYARTDARVGFHKAPANEIVEGVLDLQSEITQEIQGQAQRHRRELLCEVLLDAAFGCGVRVR